MERKHFQLASIIISTLASVGFVATASAKSSVTACQNPITQCGCTITKAGNYQVTAPLDMTNISTADCIDISASKVNLRTDGNSISGNGTGVGINVLKSAANANLQLADPKNPENPDSPSAISSFQNGIMVQGSGAIVNGFDVSDNSGDGLVIKGKNCSVMDFAADSCGGNGVSVTGSGCQISDFTASGNAGFGVSLNKAKSTVLTNFDVDDADVTGGNNAGGIELTSSSANTLSYFTADNNVGPGVSLTNSNKNLIFSFLADGSTSRSGIQLAGSSSNSLFDFFAFDNAIYGVWLQASSSNSVRFGSTLGNTQAGIYLGCAATGGPTGSACPGIKPSNKNIVTAMEAGDDPSVTLPQAYGVAVDLGDLQNSLSGISALPIPTITDGNGTSDLFDANPNCGTNIWFANASGLPPSPACTTP